MVDNAYRMLPLRKFSQMRLKFYPNYTFFYCTKDQLILPYMI